MGEPTSVGGATKRYDAMLWQQSIDEEYGSLLACKALIGFGFHTIKIGSMHLLQTSWSQTNCCSRLCRWFVVNVKWQRNEIAKLSSTFKMKDLGFPKLLRWRTKVGGKHSISSGCQQPYVCSTSITSRYSLRSEFGPPIQQQSGTCALAGVQRHIFIFETYVWLEIVEYCDADWAGDVDHRKSTTGYVFKMNSGAISWNSRKLQTDDLSFTEAEYVSLTAASQEAIWLGNLNREIIGNSNETILKYHFIRDQIVLKTIDWLMWALNTYAMINTQMLLHKPHVPQKHEYFSESCDINWIKILHMRLLYYIEPI